MEIQSKERNDIIIIQEKEDKSKSLLILDTEFDVFSSFQWKQSKDGKIHFIHLSTQDQEKENSDLLKTEIKLKDIEDSCLIRKLYLTPNKKDKLLKLDKAERIMDNRDKLKIDKFVITEWGLGKIIKKDNQIITVDIYGNPAEFPESSIRLNYSITVLVLINEASFLLDIKVDSSTSIKRFKKKIAEIVNSHSSLIVLVHSGRKVEDEKSILELGIYDKDTFMAVVKDPSETLVSRGGNTILNSKYSNNFNAVKFKCDEDIILTGLGLFRNEASDVYYDLLIYEERNGVPHLIFNEKKVLVLRKNKEGDEIFKYAISHINIKKNGLYQIHQNIIGSDISSHYSGIGFVRDIESKKSGIKFMFYDCDLTSKINGSSIEKGFIPSIYYKINIEDEV
jgi:hypothetical protein